MEVYEKAEKANNRLIEVVKVVHGENSYKYYSRKFEEAKLYE